jgi:hypothetical protein
LNWGTGREAGAPLRTPRSKDSLPFCQDESRPDSLRIELVPEEGLKPSTSGL